MLVPVPTGVPPHELEYHFQDAPVPKLPPTTVKIADEPTLMLLTLVLIDVADVLFLLMVRFKICVLHPLTKLYVPDWV